MAWIWSLIGFVAGVVASVGYAELMLRLCLFRKEIQKTDKIIARTEELSRRCQAAMDKMRKD